MNIIEILLVSLSLAADAFAISITIGLTNDRFNLKNALKTGIWFGTFQFLMPLIGFKLGKTFEPVIKAYDHWVSFTLLTIIGINLIKESFQREVIDKDKTILDMVFLSIATSIDALITGLAYSLSINRININITFISIGIITFILSTIGVYLGSKSISKLGNKSKLIGGIILIILGIKILLEHLQIISIIIS